MPKLKNRKLKLSKACAHEARPPPPPLSKAPKPFGPWPSLEALVPVNAFHDPGTGKTIDCHIRTYMYICIYYVDDVGYYRGYIRLRPCKDSDFRVFVLQ